MGDGEKRLFFKKKKSKTFFLNENNTNNNLCLTLSTSAVAQIFNATDTLNCMGTLFLWLTALIIALGIS